MMEANVNKGATGREKLKRMEICGRCSKGVDEGICCDCCKFWVHFKCEGLTESAAKVWKQMGSCARFYCTVRNCEQIAEQFINSIGPLKDQVDSNTHRIEDLEKKLATQESNVKKDTEKEVQRAISEVNKTLEAERNRIRVEVKEEMETVLQGNKDTGSGDAVERDQVKVEVQVMLEEEKDKAFRARNLIIAGVPEPDTDNLDIGKAADLKYITDLFTEHMKVDREEYGITDTTRLYRGQHVTGDKKPRLLRVRFDRQGMVGRVARASPELNSSNDGVVKNVTIFRDRSKKERDERKKLLSLAEDRNKEESDASFKWSVNFEKKEVVRLSKEMQTLKPFRQRKYR